MSCLQWNQFCSLARNNINQYKLIKNRAKYNFHPCTIDTITVTSLNYKMNQKDPYNLLLSAKNKGQFVTFCRPMNLCYSSGMQNKLCPKNMNSKQFLVHAIRIFNFKFFNLNCLICILRRLFLTPPNTSFHILKFLIKGCTFNLAKHTKDYKKLYLCHVIQFPVEELESCCR